VLVASGLNNLCLIWGLLSNHRDTRSQNLTDCKLCNFCLVLKLTGHGEGVLGRTIRCRYCRGAKRLACPLCAVDDIYEWSYSGDSEDHDGEIDAAS
jgi:hypothetical protein